MLPVEHSPAQLNQIIEGKDADEVVLQAIVSIPDAHGFRKETYTMTRSELRRVLASVLSDPLLVSRIEHQNRITKELIESGATDAPDWLRQEILGVGQRISEHIGGDKFRKDALSAQLSSIIRSYVYHNSAVSLLTQAPTHIVK